MPWIMLSVLVVTCPCALALATPTALTAGHGQLRRRGVLVTRADAIEALSQVSRVILDKTGTLTCGEMTLVETRTLGSLDAERARTLAAALEARSEHPIARAFQPFRLATVQAMDVVSRTGQGLEGTLEGRRWRLGKAEFAAPGATPEAPGGGQWLLLEIGRASCRERV